ncbi:M14 family metallopeptidase [Salipaludibacillus aurantiacus]|uniref:Zinc carboxypeptidase n=1 Tax=Salipaludibacillus aurantiacus TaxID=1601833 RepID=A0A1H9QH29_9BACI|nr:M14 family metallopeptidase [Salipaludibacillus aurantiacus]SER59073.1 Protein of unknown function [Salipaludibacillus aurantiacus]
MESEQFFSGTFEESRSQFRKSLKEIGTYWPNARLETYYTGSEEDDNTTDILAADALSEKQELIIITTGEHGIEGYTGSAFLQLFIEEYMPLINPETTGLRLVHAVNPWGMRHFRRVTENNIDLNRNYIRDWENTAGAVDETFARKKEIFLPGSRIENLSTHKRELNKALTEAFTHEELAVLKDGPPGQYKYKRGIYYGGNSFDEPAQKLKSRYFDWVKEYSHPVHIDIHSGGGPKDDLTLIFTKSDKRSEEELQKELSYKQVVKSDDDNVYGESNLYLQESVRENFPQKRTVTCLFEFGTIAETLNDLVFCTQTMINENQLYFNGVLEREDEKEIIRDFRRLFYPDKKEWRKQVIDKGRTGIEAILSSENIELSK